MRNRSHSWLTVSIVLSSSPLAAGSAPSAMASLSLTALDRAAARLISGKRPRLIRRRLSSLLRRYMSDQLLIPFGETRNMRPGSLRSMKSVCFETLTDSSQRVVNVGISVTPILEPWRILWFQDAKLHATACNGMKAFSVGFPVFYVVQCIPDCFMVL